VCVWQNYERLKHTLLSDGRRDSLIHGNGRGSLKGLQVTKLDAASRGN